MKAVIFVVCLLLSLPNLLAGFALLVVQRTLSAGDIFDLIVYFVQSVYWGVLAAVVVLLALLIAGVIGRSRPVAAVCALLLNMAALAAVLYRIGLPPDVGTGVVFLPALLGIGGFVWISLDLQQGRSQVEV